MSIIPKIIYLDQNKWVELLRAEKKPEVFPGQYAILQVLIGKVKSGQVIVPLSATNIFETYKIVDQERKLGMASLQARLSCGLVFRGRHHRIEGELSSFLAKTYKLTIPSRPVLWFLSDVFFEAFCDNGDERMGFQLPPELIELIRKNPEQALYYYLTSVPEEDRSIAVSNWSQGSEALRMRIEARRERHKNESLSMKRRIYNVLMLWEELVLLARMAEQYGVRWDSMNEIGSPVARRLINEMPIYHVERELTLRLEAQKRPIHENDFRDMQIYCAAIPYADEVIGENQMINLARQAGLGQKYQTKLETDLLFLTQKD